MDCFMTEARPSAQPVGRRRFLTTLAMLALGACSTVVPRGPAPPPPPPRVTAPAGHGLPEDRERHRVALLVPLSGSNAGVGQSLANAANLALLDTGGKGLRITTYDTAAGGAAAAAGKAIAEGNGLILGPLLGEEVRAVAPIAGRAHVPVLAFSNDVAAAGKGAFLLGFAPSQSIDRVVSYAASRGLKRIAGLVPAGLYGRRSADALLAAGREAGVAIAALQTYERTPASISAAYAKLGSDYDAVLVADSGRIALQVAPAIKRGGARLLGTELWNTEPSLAGSSAMQGAWFASVSDALYGQFAAKYRARYGKSPYRLATLGYDAVLLAARIAPDWKMDQPFPERRLTDRGGFTGVDGAFRFGGDGMAERALEVHQINSGGFVTVSPAPQGF